MTLSKVLCCQTNESLPPPGSTAEHEHGPRHDVPCPGRRPLHSPPLPHMLICSARLFCSPSPLRLASAAKKCMRETELPKNQIVVALTCSCSRGCCDKDNALALHATTSAKDGWAAPASDDAGLAWSNELKSCSGFFNIAECLPSARDDVVGRRQWQGNADAGRRDRQHWPLGPCRETF